MKKKWSNKWKSSIQPRKQRKYIYNLPLHLAKKRLRSILAKDLRKKHKIRNILLKQGDKVKIMRGDNKGKIGKVTKISYVRNFIHIENIEHIKKDGNKVPLKLKASNLMVLELNLDDKKRKLGLEKK